MRIMDALNDAISTWQKNHPAESLPNLQARIRVITPKRELLPAGLDGHALRNRIKTMGGSSIPFRKRLLIINGRAAILSFTSRAGRSEPGLSSDCAALVDDRARISDFQTWFDTMWASAEALPPPMGKAVGA